MKFSLNVTLILTKRPINFKMRTEHIRSKIVNLYHKIRSITNICAYVKYVI